MCQNKNYVNASNHPIYVIHHLLLTNDGRFQVEKDRSGNVLSCPRLTEKGVEGVIPCSSHLVWGHLSIRLDPMFQAVQLPACIANLSPSLAHMNWDTFTLQRVSNTVRLQEFDGTFMFHQIFQTTCFILLCLLWTNVELKTTKQIHFV